MDRKTSMRQPIWLVLDHPEFGCVPGLDYVVVNKLKLQTRITGYGFVVFWFEEEFYAAFTAGQDGLTRCVATFVAVDGGPHWVEQLTFNSDNEGVKNMVAWLNTLWRDRYERA